MHSAVTFFISQTTGASSLGADFRTLETEYLKSSSVSPTMTSVLLRIRSRYMSLVSGSVSPSMRSRYELMAVRGVLRSWEMLVTALLISELAAS